MCVCVFNAYSLFKMMTTFGVTSFLSTYISLLHTFSKIQIETETGWTLFELAKSCGEHLFGHYTPSLRSWAHAQPHVHVPLFTLPNSHSPRACTDLVQHAGIDHALCGHSLREWNLLDRKSTWTCLTIKVLQTKV